MPYPEYIKSKSLYRKTEKLIKEFEKVTRCNGLQDLQFEEQDSQIQRMFRSALGQLKEFRDNIDNNDAF